MTAGKKSANSLSTPSKAGVVDKSDITTLEELFHKKSGKGKDPKSCSADTPGGSAKKKQKKRVPLIDMTRANNVAISLKAFKEFTFDDIVKILNTLDSEKKIMGDRITFLASVLPSSIEAKALSHFNGPEEDLLSAELFFKKLQGLKA